MSRPLTPSPSPSRGEGSKSTSTTPPRSLRERGLGGEGASPLVSVVVPTRNRARYLRELLAALEGQRYKRNEVIVVDDASSDETAAVLRAWQGDGRVALRQDE